MCHAWSRLKYCEPNRVFTCLCAPYSDEINENEYIFYEFVITKFTNSTEKVQFTLTPIFGEVVMYASQTEKFPTNQSYDKVSYQNFISYSREQHDQLTERYYLSVYSESYSYYMLTVKINQKSEDYDLVYYLQQGTAALSPATTACHALLLEHRPVSPCVQGFHFLRSVPSSSFHTILTCSFIRLMSKTHRRRSSSAATNRRYISDSAWP